MNRYLATITQNYKDKTTSKRTVEFFAKDDEEANAKALGRLDTSHPVMFEKLEEVKFLSKI